MGAAFSRDLDAMRSAFSLDFHLTFTLYFKRSFKGQCVYFGLRISNFEIIALRFQCFEQLGRFDFLPTAYHLPFTVYDLTIFTVSTV